MARSGALAPQPLVLAPRFVNNVYVTAEISCSTVHARHEVLAWSQGVLCLFARKAVAAPALGLPWSGIMVMLREIMLWLLFGYVMTAAVAAVSARREAVLWLPCQPGENKRVCNS